MTFLQPMLLWGVPLLLIPVAIHLMNRLRYRSVRWAAMIFLLKASRNSTSMARVRQWLVLLLRVLAVAALVLALARPLLGGWLGWTLSGPPDTVVLLLDRSASMGMRTKKGASILKLAVAEIAEAGNSVAHDAEIILLDSATLQTSRIPSWSVLPKLDAVRPTETAADIPAMFSAALDQLLRGNAGKSEIWVLSDLQRSNWRPSDPLWQTLDAKLKSLKTPPRIRLLSLSANAVANRSLTFVNVSRHTVASGREVREVTFDIHSPENSTATEIPLLIGDNSGTRQVMASVSPGICRISRRIATVSDKSKTSWGFLKLPPDSNPLDDSIFYAFGKTPKEKAVVISRSLDCADLLALAAAPSKSSDASAEIISPEKAVSESLDDASCVIVDSQPDAKLAGEIHSLAENGAAILFFPPDDFSDSSEEWLPVESFNTVKPMTISDWNHRDGILADTPSGSVIPLDTIRILKRSVPVVRDARTNVLAYCADGKPFLTRERVGAGAFYRCSSPPKVDWSNLGEGLALVPMERRLMKKGSARFASTKFRNCGNLTGISNVSPPTVLASISYDGKNRRAEPNLNTGIYSWSGETVVVNLPELETQYFIMSDKETAALLPDLKIRLFREDGSGDGRMQAEIWRWFLFVVLLALTVESLATIPKRVSGKSPSL